MKIAYILNSSDMFGGASKSFMALLQGVIKAGHEAMVVLPDAGPLKEVLDKLKVETHVLTYRPNLYPYDESLKDYILWIPRLLARRFVNGKAVRQLCGMLEGYDIVHTNVSVIDIGQRAASQCNIPHVYHFREYGDLDFGYRYFPSKSRFMKTVDWSICITRGIQQHHALCDNRKSVVIYNGIRPRLAQMPEQDGKEEKYVLFAGRLEPAKGCEMAIEAFCKANLSACLKIAGESLNEMYLSGLKRIVEKYNMVDRVQFLGAVDNVQELMRNAVATIVASKFEGFGRVAAEAMFSGCIVVGRNTGGTMEQFNNGLRYTGGEIGFRFTTVNELVQCLRSIFRMPDEKLYDVRQRAFRTVNNFYTTEASVESVINFYNIIKNDGSAENH